MPPKTFRGSGIYGLPRKTFRGPDVYGTFVEDFVAEGDGSTVLAGTVGPCENYSPSMGIAVIKDIVGLVSGFDIIADSTSPQADALKFVSAEDGNCPESQFLQRYAVAVLYYSLAGIFWENNENYMSSSHECGWYGITCNEEKIIVELDLSGNFLFGSIPNEISLLSSLSSLNLSENSIFGSITPSISLLKMLDSLYLNDNNLVGGIPEDIYGMTFLKNFHVDHNYLSGTISSSVGDLVAIEDMIMWDNHFEGTIPAEIAFLKNIRKLHVDTNAFTGGVHPSICQNFRENNRFVEFTTDCYEVKCDCCICF